MERIIKILLVGTSVVGIAKYFVVLLLTGIAVGIIENGGNDGRLEPASVLVGIVGLMLTLLSVAMTIHFNRKA